jgi:hypothetical protein
MAVFKDSSDLDSKRLSAYIALVKANSSALAVHLADALSAAAMRAYWTARPYPGLHEAVGGFLIVEVGGGND